MGLTYPTYLEGTVYVCIKCRTHLASETDLLSKDFQGRYGKAYLFEQVVNYEQGNETERAMTTGFHTIRDIHCGKCRVVLGWIYTKAFNDDNKYKEGKFVLEKKLLDEV